MQAPDEKGLTEAARLMLLRVIELNGGRVHRGAIQKTLLELHEQENVEVIFNPETPKNHTEYDFQLTKKGQDVLDVLKEAQVKKLDVQVMKEKKGRPTVLKFQGNTYILQPQAVNKNKKSENWAGQNFPDSKY
jgi:hypothetical protein